MTGDRCGTNAGYHAHRRRDEPACPDCRAAAAAYERRRVAVAYLTRGQALLVDATGTGRRLRALMRIGWPLHELARRIGMTAQNLAKCPQRPRVLLSTAGKVRALYDELSMTPGPSRRSAGYAIGQGWPPPLAWDDDTIDDPAARPAHNVHGHEQGKPRNPDLEDRVLVLTRAGLSAAEIAVRLRTTKRYVQRVRARARQEDVA